MTKTIKKVIAGVSALAIIAGVAVGGWAINEYAVKDNDFVIQSPVADYSGGVVAGKNDNKAVMQGTAVRGVQFMSTAVRAETGVSKTITATVQPASAENKAVDWSLKWADGAALASSPISEYATVTPQSDGSTTVTLNFLKAFLGSDMILTVTTREGGFTDTAIVRYTGIPDTLSVSDWKTEMGVNNSYDFDLELSAPLGVVGDKFNDFTVSVSCPFSIIVDDYTQTITVNGTNVTTQNTWANEPTEITVNSIINELVTASVSDGVLHIQPKKTIENYYESIDANNTSTVFNTIYRNKFKSFKTIAGMETGYGLITVTVKENVSGVTASYQFAIKQTVTGVTVSDDFIEI